MGTMSVYFLHLASVHRKPVISNPFTLQNFLFCHNKETFQRNGLEGTSPTLPCNLSSRLDWAMWGVLIINHYQMGWFHILGLRSNLHLLCFISRDTCLSIAHFKPHIPHSEFRRDLMWAQYMRALIVLQRDGRHFFMPAFCRTEDSV